jgi:hypothetical protein
MSAIMSTVTVRELHRNTAAVLEASQRDGGVIVRHRDGREFTLAPVEPAKPKKPEWPDFKARRLRIFPEPIPADICAKVDKAIRGE